MKNMCLRVLITAFALALGSVALAQDEPLPARVAQAYQAYEDALLAQDEAAATAAAATAWRAAREARIDPELVGILAANYGQMAQARGEYDEAYDAWRSAAEISDRLRAPAPDRALRWYNAGVAAFADGNRLDAHRCLTRSLGAQPAGVDGPDAELFGNSRYLIAAITAQRGRLNGLGTNVRAAISAFQASGRAFDATYAHAHYLSGIVYYLEGDFAAGAMDFNMARGMLATEGEAAGQVDNRVPAMWLLLALGQLGGAEREALDARLAASEFPPPPERRPTPIGDENNHDAAPIFRIEPRYPREAAREGIEGVSLVHFNLSADGIPEDIEVITSIPEGMFGAASVQAVTQWRYHPAVRDGQAVPRAGVETAFVFLLGRPRD